MSNITVVIREKKRTDGSVIESPKGKCFLDDKGNDIWLPKSQIVSTVIDANSVEVTLPEWLAKDKGFL